MAGAPQAWMVCYDITCDKRRTKVYKTMRGYGDHIQFSVFRCVLSAQQVVELRTKLEATIHAHDDQILMVPLGPPDSTRFREWISLGKAVEAMERTVVIL